MSYRFADCFLAGSGSSVLILLASSQHNLYDINLLLCIQYQTPDDGQKTCPNYVEFYSKNKFEKLVHLVGFIMGMYHDARSSECQTRQKSVITSSHISFSVMFHKQLSVPWSRISSRPPTKEDHFPFQASSCRICGGQSDAFLVSLRVLLFLPSGSFLQCFI